MKDNPSFVDLKIVDKWDGLTPLVIGGGENMMYQLQDLERLRQQPPHTVVFAGSVQDFNAWHKTAVAIPGVRLS